MLSSKVRKSFAPRTTGVWRKPGRVGIAPWSEARIFITGLSRKLKTDCPAFAKPPPLCEMLYYWNRGQARFKFMKTTITFRDWEFEIDHDATKLVYDQVEQGGAEVCGCEDCRNYVLNRKSVFPKDVLEFLINVGIDYTKEVEVTVFENRPDRSRLIGGWFHFLGNIVEGERYRQPPDGSMELTPINSVFSIGFAPESTLAYFKPTSAIIQVEFMTVIPWLLRKTKFLN
ncbi:MAG: hypothetical protein EOO88_19425 [Pedobacter sp.]|nr:MAG: hypothetical protein EOO88_19425 [Pedobacter sp.]